MAEFEDDEVPDALCEGCGEPLDASQVSVESFELSGKILCADCADGFLDGPHSN